MTLLDDFQKIKFVMIFHENHDFQELYALRRHNIEFHNCLPKASWQVPGH